MLQWVRPVQPLSLDDLAAEIGFMCSHATSAIKRVKDELVWSGLIPFWIELYPRTGILPLDLTTGFALTLLTHATVGAKAVPSH